MAKSKKITVQCGSCGGAKLEALLHVRAERPEDLTEDGVKPGAKLNLADAIVDHFWCNDCDMDVEVEATT